MPISLTTSNSRLLRLPASEYTTALKFFCWLAAVFCLDLLPGPYAMHYLFDVMQTAGSQALYTGPHFLANGPFSWDPSRWAGLPSSIAYSPPFGFHSVLLSFMPMWLYYTLQKLILLTALGFGMYRLLREYAQAPAPAAMLLLVPTYLTMTGGQTVVVEAYSFPLVFAWTLDFARGVGSRPMRIAKGVAIVLLFSMTCLVYVLPYFLPLAVMLALLAPAHADKKRHLGITALVWGGYFLMMLPLLWGFWDFLPTVNRVDHPPPPLQSSKALLALAKAYLASFLSVNALPALFCLPSAWRDGRFRLLFGITAAYALIVAVLSSPFYDHWLAGTLLHKAHIYRAAMILPYCHLILSGYGLSLTTQLPRYSWALAALAAGLAAADRSEARAILGAGSVAFCILGLHIFVTRQTQLRRGLILVLLALVFFLAANARLREQISDDTHDLYATGFGNHPEMATLARQATGPVRTASVDLDPSIAKSYGFETLDGKYELAFKRFNDYMREVASPQFPDKAAAHAHFDNQMLLYVTPPLKKKEHHSHSFNKGLPRSAEDFNIGLLLAAGVRHVFSSKPIQGMEQYADLLFVDPGRGLPFAASSPVASYYHLPIHAYRMRDALGEAYFAPSVAISDTPGQTLSELSQAGPEGVRSAVFIARSDLSGLDVAAKARVEALAEGPRVQASSEAAVRPDPDSIEVRFHASGPGLLVLADNFDKGWRATLDGAPAQIIRANYAFQAVLVDAPGAHHVVLRHREPLFLALHWATLVGMLCIMAASIARRKSPDSSEPECRPRQHFALPEAPILGTWLMISLCAVLWTAGFVKFVWFKGTPDGWPFWYVAATVPLVSAAACGLLLHWYAWLRASVTPDT